jgi:UDP-glucose 4-epimerase
MAERIIVTGGAGFIGSHIVDTLIGAGYEVAVIDNLSTGRRENLNPKATFYEVDICDADALERVFAETKPVAVSHQAAMADVRGSIEEPDAYAMVNVIGTLRLLKAACRHGTRKIVMASTGGAIYGEGVPLPATEDTVAHPLDPYGVSKLSGEHYLYAFRHNFGLDYCALRYGNIYGPRQNPFGEAGVVAIFCGRMLRGQPLTINGDGKQQRDFTYVGDVADANLRAIQSGSGVYNIGTGIGSDVNTVFEHLARLTGYTMPAQYGPAKAGEVRANMVDATRARRDLGWQAQVSLADGLALTVAHMRAAM